MNVSWGRVPLRYRVLGFFLSVALTGAADADQTASPQTEALELTLADAIGLALQNNRDLINVHLDREVQKMVLRVAEDKFRPDATIAPYTDYQVLGSNNDLESVDSGVSTGFSLLVPTGGRFAVTLNNSVSDQDDTTYRSLVTVSFSQPLLKGRGIAVNRASVKTARLNEQGNVLALRSAIMNTIDSVIRAYRSFIQAQQRLEIATRSLERARAQLEVNRILIQTGRMAEQDIVQTETDVANRELSLAEAGNNLDAARLSLIEVLDIDSHIQVTPTEELAVNPVDPALLDMSRSLESALRNRPDYNQARIRIENAETEFLLAKNNRLWDLSANFAVNVTEFGESYNAFGSLDRGDYRVGLDLTIPLGDLTRRQRYINARTSLMQARNQLSELRQAVDIDVRNAVREVEVRFRQVSLARRTRELSEQQFEVEKDKLNLGLSTNFRVSSYEEDLVRARNGEVDSIISYLNAVTALDRTLGTTMDTWNVDVEELGK